MADITGTTGNDTKDGTILGDTIDGREGDDTLHGRRGADTIIGGLGNDKLFGDQGDDTFLVGDGEAKIAEIYDGGDGFDTLDLSSNIGTLTGPHVAIFDISSLQSIERLRYSGAGEHITRISAFHMGDGGLAANLQVVGANALDQLFIDNNTETTIDASAWTFSNWTGRITFECTSANELVKGSSAGETFGPSAGIDKIFGNGGGDTLILDGTQQNTEIYDGGAGTDTLQFTGAENNLGPGDYLSIEAFNFRSNGFLAEQRAIISAADFGGGGISSSLRLTTTPGQGLEIVQIGMLGETNFSASGFTFQRFQQANFTIEIDGGEASENISGSTASDVILGGGGIDFLFGIGGDDRLDGGAGGDVMAGGSGNDTYVADSAGDVLTELQALADAGGNDTVEAGFDFTLQSLFENLVLTGSDAIAGTGNDAGNAITGNDAANVLKGLGGADTLLGAGGADDLAGGAGADTFLYAQTDDSIAGKSTRDIVRGFQAGTDLFDLTDIDANSVLDGIQDLVFDTGGKLTAGEFRLREANGSTFLEANTDGDTGLEFQVFIKGVTGLTDGDIVV